MNHIISLGAGVQSSTMALMAALGKISPMPLAAIFADTQAEPHKVYEWLDWLELQLPFPVYRVTAGSLFDVIGKPRIRGLWPIMPIPAFIQMANGKPAPANRSCTQDYKIIPIRRKVRELAGLFRKRSPLVPVVTQWIGISTDEAHRMKPSREQWVAHRWPLIEEEMSRQDCLDWMNEHGFPKPPKSSCTFCPYHDKTQWLEVQRDPAAWAQAVEVDERVRRLWHGRVPSDMFLHRSLVPLRGINFDAEPQTKGDPFGNECEGMCGV